MKNRIIGWLGNVTLSFLVLIPLFCQIDICKGGPPGCEFLSFGSLYDLKVPKIKESKAAIILQNKNKPPETTGYKSAAYGLIEAASRKGWRELEDTRREDTWLSERLIFHDVSTGSILWRMTCDPAIDVLDYYDIPAWNADGSLIFFFNPGRTKTPGEKWIMDGNGKNLRCLSSPTEGRLEDTFWSLIDPLKMYYSYFKDGQTHVAVINPLTGKDSIIVIADIDLGQMMPPHPSEKWFLFASQTGEHKDSSTIVYTLGIDGKIEKFNLEKCTHRLRFTTSPDRRIFFNFDNPRTSWTILPDGNRRFEIPSSGFHPGWTKEGQEMTVYSGVDLGGYSYDGSNKRLIATLGTGGHGSACPDGIWFYSDGPSILAIKLDGSQTVFTIAKQYTSGLSHASSWHPQSHSTHAHPVSSPDGTKAIYNSDALSQYTDIYVVVVRPPDPPKNLKAQWERDATVLSWDKPFRSRETRGYHIYRAEQSGLGYLRLTATPVKNLSWKVPGRYKGGFYVVTAVENSGLEGGGSNEVFGAGNENWQGPVRIMFEAEMGIPSLPMREAIDPIKASNGWFMNVPRDENLGILKLEVKVPKSSDYYVWGRVRGNGTAQVQCDDQKASYLESGGSGWTWQRLEKRLTMFAGVHTLMLTGTEFDVDKILLTDDVSFKPKDMMKLDTTPPPSPRYVKAQTLSANAIRLSWDPLTGANTDDIDHYNVYCSPDEAFTVSQASRIRSPSECEMVDWGLPLNSARYYRVTAVDRSGNESLASPSLKASVEPLKPVSIRLTAETAQVEGMKAEPVKTIAKDGATTVLSVISEKSEASWKFEIPNDGKYAIWVLSTHHNKVPSGIKREDNPPGNTSNESIFNISIDGNAIATQVVTRGPWDTWNWSPAGNMATGTPQRFEIKAGKHTIHFKPGSDKSNVAQVMITNNPSWDPVEGMSLFRK